MLANLPKVTKVSDRVKTQDLSNSEIQTLLLHPQPGEKGGPEEVSDQGEEKD